MMKINMLKLSSTMTAIVLMLGGSQAGAQTTVFSADFEAASTDASFSLFDNDTNPVFDVNVGSVSFAKGGIINIPGNPNDGERVGEPQLYDLNNQLDLDQGGTGGFLADHTDWGDQTLAFERNSDKTENEDGSPLTGGNMEWIFTEPVELDGAQIDFEFYMMRANTGPAKHQFVSGFDTQGRELFEILLIARNTYAYADFPDYDNIGGSTGNERQDRTVGYIDPVNGDELLFSSAQIATGAIPDTNPGDAGTGDQVGLFGATPATINNSNDKNHFEIDDAALFSISLTDTGWTLAVEAAPTPDDDTTSLSDFSTIEIAFSDSQVSDLASIEVQVATDQGGGWWDNLLVTGNTLSTGTPGDADGDGDVDGSDLLLLQRTNPAGIPDWQANYGTSSLAAVAGSVPEPSTLGLASLAALALLGLRRTKLD